MKITFRAASILLLCAAQLAWADCKYFTQTDMESVVIEELGGVLQMQVDRSVGSVIYRSSPQFVENTQVECMGFTEFNAIPVYGVSSLSPDIFKLRLGNNSNVLGVRVLLDGQALQAGVNNFSFFYSFAGEVVIEFIKLDEELKNALSQTSISGKFLSLETVRCKQDEELSRSGVCAWPDSSEELMQLSVDGQLSIEPATCSVMVDPIAVELPTVAASKFHGEGSVAGLTEFAIDLECNVENMGLQITLDSSYAINKSIGLLRSYKRGSGYTADFGIQVLTSNGQPVMFSEPIMVGETQASMSINFSAQYYQTGALGRAGRVYSSATYTLTYD